MKKTLLYFLMLTGFSFSIQSCLEVEVLPDEPIITFRSFETFQDSAVLTIGFQDGDGDIGLDQADTLDPFEVDGPYYFNLLCDYYELQNGEWVVFDDLETPFYYRVPRVTPTGQNPTLNGEMKVSLPPLYYVPGTGFDTCRFEVRLYDRSLNISNSVTSSSFVKP